MDLDVGRDSVSPTVGKLSVFLSETGLCKVSQSRDLVFLSTCTRSFARVRVQHIKVFSPP